MNLLTDLPHILIRELGRITGMFLKGVIKNVPTYILNSRALNSGNKIFWIYFWLILVIMKLVHAKKIGFGNDLVVVFGHLRLCVKNCSWTVDTYRLYQPSKLYKGSYLCPHTSSLQWCFSSGLAGQGLYCYFYLVCFF